MGEYLSMTKIIFPSLKTLQPVEFSELEGKIIVDIRRLWVGSNEVIFVCSDDTEYMLYPAEDSEEIPSIVSIIGNVGDTLDSPVIWIKRGCYTNSFQLETKHSSLTIIWNRGKVDFIRIK